MTTYTLNKEHNGIEIYFDGKPSEAIRDSLKSLKYRWHSVKKCWYAKETPERLDLAKSLTDGTQGPETIQTAKTYIANKDTRRNPMYNNLIKAISSEYIKLKHYIDEAHTTRNSWKYADAMQVIISCEKIQLMVNIMRTECGHVNELSGRLLESSKTFRRDAEAILSGIMMNAKYYKKIYMNGDRVELFDEDLKFICTMDVNIDSFGHITAKGTGLPIVEGLTQVVKKSDVLGAFLETEPIEGTDFLKVKGHIEMTDEQIKDYDKNLEL